MTIVEINTVLHGSTGSIMRQIALETRKHGHACYMVVPKGRHNHMGPDHVIWLGNQVSEDLHILLGRVTGLQGYFSFFATLSLLARLERLRPDVIHLHNLHNSYINLPLLFRYIKYRRISVLWTLHDCWAFTGHCPHFSMIGCGKWKTGCFACPQYRDYPQSWVDSSRLLWRKKKNWFSDVRMTVVTPSKWLRGLVKQSFLGNYPVRVINNGIDLSVFKPTFGDFRERYSIPPERKILLGVAAEWNAQKGLDAFNQLAEQLDRTSYQIVLVGTNEKSEQRLNEAIISIRKTADRRELAEIYTAAAVFVNPTWEDTFPTVNMEALACGTPVVTYRTGGSPEIIDGSCGCVVERGDLAALLRECVRICTQKPYTEEDCVRRAGLYDSQRTFRQYAALYEEICHDGTAKG